MTQIDDNADAIGDFARRDVAAIALLLDVDGTLIDIGPTPQNVHVPQDLCRALERLLVATGGACALVSGRLIADLDHLFSPLRLPALGAHGAEMRLAGEGIVSAAEPLPLRLRKYLTQAAGGGVIVEDKGYSVTLHFRNAPQREAELNALAASACTMCPGEDLVVLPGKAVFEIKRRGISKGAGVARLMTLPPFAGRRPVFIGDDVTDQAVFAILPKLGGVGYSVGRRYPGVTHIFRSPADVRRAIQDMARRHTTLETE